ncbi:MAG: type sorting protein [Segetibacter sp.]|nr:type sorting protein [Segetibacter sp.]
MPQHVNINKHSSLTYSSFKTITTTKIYIMKKFFILMVMLAACTSSFAFLTQSTYRWRNNNGTETSATWKAAQNTPIVYNSIHEVLRLRVEVYNTNSGAPIAVEDSLQYSTDGTNWTNITNSTAKDFVLAGTFSLVPQNTPTTSQLTGNSYPFVPGKVMTTDTVLKGVAIPQSQRSEFEWAILGTASTKPNMDYYFRHWGSTSNNLPPGASYPTLTTGATLPMKLTGFLVKHDGRRIRIEWTTANEQDNDRFEIERSANGRSWQIVSTVKAKGTSSAATNYSAFDNSPINGINYYRLKQYDLDGKSTLSEVRSVKLGDAKYIVTVTPNPARSAINFKLENHSPANILAVLCDANGKIVHSETFKNVQANGLNKLNLKQQPTTGIYILTLKAEGLSESSKVVFQ